MASDLVRAVERLNLGSAAQDPDYDNSTDDTLSRQRPSRRVKQDAENLKKQLETNYLNPPYVFPQ